MRSALPVVLLLGACVHYKAAPLDMEATVLDAPKPPEGSLPYERAVEWAVLHNPDLLALRKRAAAVNVSVPPEPPEISAGVDSDQNPELILVLDVFSLLGMGRRGADKALARARQNEAWMAHHERAREIAGDRLGDLLTATAGVFQIREPHSNEVQGYGIYSTATREKEITVTVRASYRMR